ncbi:MAG: hypothetical protein LIO56_05905 [Lachnospiraceae bacterium]|nr:hypothetical protein [Lachnospiraceae bacterium]
MISAFYSALGTIIFPLYACAKEVVRRYKPYLDSLGLTYTKYITMMVLWEYGRMSVKELGERLLTVAPTERGMQLRDDAVEVPKKLGGCIDLSGEEMSTLYRLLYKVLGKNIEL